MLIQVEIGMFKSLESYPMPDKDLGDGNRVCIKGVLSKWTNYYHGWQERYVCCEEGSLCYFRAQEEISFGCRGSISLAKAYITPHQFDLCRFDVTINDSTWYLRTATEEERQQWIDAIEANMLVEDSLSLGSEQSSSALHSNAGWFTTQVSELQTLCNILSNQADALQRYFDACVSFSKLHNVKNSMKQNDVGTPVDADRFLFSEGPLELSSADLERKALSFKVTANGVESTLNNFLLTVQEREEMWREKHEKLQKQINEKQKDPLNLKSSLAGNDESDDEFYDPNNNFELTSKQMRHRFAGDVEEKVKEHLEASFNISESDSSKWELLTTDEELKLFRTELIKDGVVCDPMKAVHKVRGVTGRELCYYFWETSCRKEWDHTIDELNVLEEVDDATVIIHQIHKQVWPVTQRDCLYISTLQKIKNPPPTASGPLPSDTWIVSNFSVDHQQGALAPGRVRAEVEVALVCQTFISPSATNSNLTRDDVTCDIVYIANVNPGGWAPASVLRAIGKREYPKFLKNFTNFVKEKTKSCDMLF